LDFPSPARYRRPVSWATVPPPNRPSPRTDPLAHGEGDLTKEHGAKSIDDLGLPEVDFFGVDYLTNPLAVCRAAREKAWAAKTKHGLFVLTHADVNELLRYPAEQMYEMDIATMLRPEDDEEFASAPIQDRLAALRLFMGPASQHVRMRSLCHKLFNSYRLRYRLAPEPCPAPDTQPRLQSPVLLPIFQRGPDEQAADDNGG
jgi:hypothetical protein